MKINNYTRKEFIEMLERDEYGYNGKYTCPGDLGIDMFCPGGSCEVCWMKAIKNIKFKDEICDSENGITIDEASKLDVVEGTFKYPTKVDKHVKICMDLNNLYKNKNHDYGDSFGETYSKLGIISAVTRITDKVNRLQNLCMKEQLVNDESIKDTLTDLANYAIMTLIELEEDV